MTMTSTSTTATAATTTTNAETILDTPSSTQFDALLEQVQLRDAIKLLKENPEKIKLTRERWNKIFQAIEERTASAEENTENVRKLESMEFPLESAARQEMTAMYQALRDQQHLALYGAVPSTEPLVAGSHNIPPALLEEILNLPMKALTPQATNSIWIAGVTLAVVEGLISVGLSIPFNALVFWTVMAVVLDRMFLNGAVFESFLKVFSPGVQAKILRHEAGHFLTAYLLGCPVEGIVLSAWAALQDRRFGSRQVSAGTSFFDPELSQQINSGGSTLTRASIDRYSIIVMAGIAAEADFYGRADGGAGDEMALVAFLSRLNGKRGATTVWNADAIRNQARWGALQAVLMLREYKPAYEALVDALERGGKLGDCIYAIEKAARDHNLKPRTQPVGYLLDGLQGGTTWSQELPASSTVKAAAAPSSTARETLLEPVLMTAAAKQKRSDSSTAVMNEEESLEVLREYKAVMEKRLQELDQQLKDLQA